ncbi:hypothetical protein GOODEAATRI_031136 [Goodea atripinnis]|uniref:Uncharacterized protein n=1 Tax=Goodea atripinnis TaxID=208336 RepID=A0ABV0N5P9_9TELE
MSRNLATRRSISVPDLTFTPGEADSAESEVLATPSGAIYFGISPDPSELDSVASSSKNEGPPFADEPTDSLSLLSALPAEDAIYMKNLNPESKRNVHIEDISAQEDKKPKENVQKFIFEPIKEPDSNQAEKDRPFDEEPQTRRKMSDTIAAILDRASSMGNERRPHVEKRTVMFETKMPTFEKLTLQTSRPNSAERLSLQDVQFDGTDAVSLYSACGTPSEEQVNMLWATTREEEDIEQVYSFSLLREMSMDDGLLDLENQDEFLEEVS